MKPWDLMRWAFEVKLPAPDLPEKDSIRESSMRLVLVNIVFHFNSREKMAWPGLLTMARETGLEIKTVTKAIAALERMGLVLKDRREGRHGHNRYRLSIDPPAREVDRTPNNGDTTKTVESPIKTVEPPVLGVEQQSSELQSKNNNQEGGSTPNGNGQGKARVRASSTTNRRVSTRVVLPGWLDGGLWRDFAEHRKAIGKPMTPRAQEFAVETLSNLRENGNDPTTVIKHSIANGWPGLYELKNEEKTGPGYTEPSEVYSSPRASTPTGPVGNHILKTATERRGK